MSKIGVFDSGVGGLTVLYELQKNMPNESYVYFGDTKRVPYGDKTTEELIGYGKEIVSFLQTKEIDICVVACNTICATALEILKKDFDITFFGVAESGIESVVDRNLEKICVIATSRTIEFNIYEKGIRKLKKDIEILNIATPKFTKIVEGGLANSDIAKDAINEYMQKVKKENFDAIVLGCTHYPFLELDLKREFPNLLLIDPAIKLAENTKKYLKENNLLVSDGIEGNIEFFVTGDVTKFNEVKNKFYEVFQKYETYEHNFES